jgi:hypothetical protein
VLDERAATAVYEDGRHAASRAVEWPRVANIVL